MLRRCRRVALRISRTVFSALSGMRLLACLIVAPQRATMSQQSSLTQSAHSVRQVLTAYSRDKPRPVAHHQADWGAWMIPLLGQWALQLVENQLAMLLEYAQRPFERMEQRLSNLQGVANIQRVLDDHALASDVGRHFGNVTVGLGKMAANHRSKDTGIPDCEKSKPRLGRCTSAKRTYDAGRPVCVVEVEARACPLRQLLR